MIRAECSHVPGSLLGTLGCSLLLSFKLLHHHFQVAFGPLGEVVAVPGGGEWIQVPVMVRTDLLKSS